MLRWFDLRPRHSCGVREESWKDEQFDARAVLGAGVNLNGRNGRKGAKYVVGGILGKLLKEGEPGSRKNRPDVGCWGPAFGIPRCDHENLLEINGGGPGVAHGSAP